MEYMPKRAYLCIVKRNKEYLYDIQNNIRITTRKIVLKRYIHQDNKTRKGAVRFVIITNLKAYGVETGNRLSLAEQKG